MTEQTKTAAPAAKGDEGKPAKPGIHDRMRDIESRQAEDSAKMDELVSQVGQLAEILKAREGPDVHAKTPKFDALERMGSSGGRIVSTADGTVVAGIADDMSDVSNREVEAKLNQMVTAQFMRNDSEPDGASDIVAYVNGEQYVIPRGVPVGLKLSVVLAISDAWQADFQESGNMMDQAGRLADKQVNLINIVERSHPRYMVVLLGESAKDELAQRLLNRSVAARPHEQNKLVLATETDPRVLAA